MRAVFLLLLTLALGVAPAEARWWRWHTHHHQQYDSPAELVPPDWQMQAPDPSWKGERFLSPDGAAWFAIYASPADQEPIAAHLKAVAFADGEQITYLQGEQDRLAVSGLKGNRIFYRKAVLACAGRSWHHIAFEYPFEQQRRMDAVVRRAAAAIDRAEDDGCEQAVSAAP